MIVIGLTGGIASGKSTVSKHMRELGLPVFDADKTAHEVVAKGTEGLKKVIEAFGEEYLLDGELNRKKLGDLVFNNKDKLKVLEGIVHNRIWSRARAFIAEHRKAGDKAVVMDVPILIETGWYKDVDEIWLVNVNPAEQIRRVMVRDNATEEQAKARLASQMSNEELKKYAKIVIDSSDSIKTTLSQVDKEVKELFGRCAS